MFDSKIDYEGYRDWLFSRRDRLFDNRFNHNYYMEDDEEW
jgi:hypothetical protein